jgi:cell division protein FtsZ
MIEFVQEEKKKVAPIARIKVMGIGGAGGNTINCMIEAGLENIEFIAANTDAQALEMSLAKHKFQLGAKLTKGLGSGSNPEVGRRAAEEDLENITEHIQDADIVFLTGGLGGGTGSGGLPVAAHQLKEHNILSIAVVTKPFEFEGKRRMRIAEEALEKLKKEVDTIVVIPNQKLLAVAQKNMSLVNAFNMVNEVIAQFVESISNIITRPGHINVDFADVKEIMKNMGIAVMGTGRASGEHRAEEAALQAISSPLLEEHSIQGARGILMNITGNKDLGLHEVSAAASLLYEQAHEDASIVLGSVIDESMGDEVSITIIATGFDHKKIQEAALESYESKEEAILSPQKQENPETPKQQPSQSEKPQKDTNLINLEDIEIPTVLRRMAEERRAHNND